MGTAVMTLIWLNTVMLIANSIVTSIHSHTILKEVRGSGKNAKRD